MEKFTISVDKGVGAIDMQMEPGKDAMEVAKALSLQFADHHVSVSMFARCRRNYLNGKITMSNPDINMFFLGSAKQDKWSWSCYGEVID